MSRTKIQSVAPGTPAHQAGVRPGETLLAINGHPIVDVLDYKYYAYDPELVLQLRSEAGERTVELSKDVGEDLGLDLCHLPYGPGPLLCQQVRVLLCGSDAPGHAGHLIF